MQSAKRTDIRSITAEPAENERCGDDQEIKVHRLCIDGSDPVALFVELLRKL